MTMLMAPEKLPLTFQLHDCYADRKMMNGGNTNSGGWTSCDMRSTHLPAILALMPTEVQNGIQEVNKLTSEGSQSSHHQHHGGQAIPAERDRDFW